MEARLNAAFSQCFCALHADAEKKNAPFTLKIHFWP
jgi:hypothetical protein